MLSAGPGVKEWVEVCLVGVQDTPHTSLATVARDHRARRSGVTEYYGHQDQ